MTHFDADIGWPKLLAGLGGAVVSMQFVKGTKIERSVMVAGGIALSFYGTTPAAQFVGMSTAEGLVGFVIGMFGMSIVAKCYEAISAIDGKQIVDDVTDFILRRRRD